MPAGADDLSLSQLAVQLEGLNTAIKALHTQDAAPAADHRTVTQEGTADQGQETGYNAQIIIPEGVRSGDTLWLPNPDGWVIAL